VQNRYQIWDKAGWYSASMKWEDVKIPEKDPLLELWQGQNLENWFYLTQPFLAVWKAVVMSNAFDSFQLFGFM
jgi:hypothetical protein